jgi:hypothetical protein
MSRQINENIVETKAEYRKARAAESFDKKLVDLVRLQMMNHSLSQSAGKASRRPWHADDPDRMRIYRQNGADQRRL